MKERDPSQAVCTRLRQAREHNFSFTSDGHGVARTFISTPDAAARTATLETVLRRRTSRGSAPRRLSTMIAAGDEQRVVYMVGSARFRVASRVARRFDKRVIIHGAAPSPRSGTEDGWNFSEGSETPSPDRGEKNTRAAGRRALANARRANLYAASITNHKPALVARAIEDVLDSRVTTNNHEIPASRVRAGTL